MPSKKTPDNAKAAPMAHVSLRLPNLRNQIRAATDAGAESVELAADREESAVEINPPSR